MSNSELLDAATPVIMAFETLNTRYYVGGSVASSLYGHPRSTLDIDLVADLRSSDVTGFVNLIGSDYYASESMIRNAIANKSCFNLIYMPTSFKVDVFAVKDRAFDRESMSRVRMDRIGTSGCNRDVWVASPEDTVLNKLEWFKKGDRISERQWRDIQEILRVQKNTIDTSYLRRWAGDLQLTELLAEALADAAIE